ncbi:GNAT family N-acetyltransferase [Leifsonia sp. NPDC058248]|uniref:GNAT family N-acetyltransferase n=1 Tax=Leifsonia sp. NPDC058248 TaxID=3346402 RepID=UPI0036DB3011
MAPVLRTPRLVLRPHRMSDVEAWLRIERDSSIQANLHWPERDRRQMITHLRDRTRKTVLRQAGDFLALAVELDGEVIGDVSMHLRTVAPESRSAEVGWLQLSRYRGQGFATEAAEALLTFAFRTLGTRWVTALVDANNERSMALAVRLGFARVAQTGCTVTFLATGAPTTVNGSETTANGTDSTVLSTIREERCL